VSDSPARHMPGVDCSFDVLGLGTKAPWRAQRSRCDGVSFSPPRAKLIDVSSHICDRKGPPAQVTDESRRRADHVHLSDLLGVRGASAVARSISRDRRWCA